VRLERARELGWWLFLAAGLVARGVWAVGQVDVSFRVRRFVGFARLPFFELVSRERGVVLSSRMGWVEAVVFTRYARLVALRGGVRVLRTVVMRRFVRGFVRRFVFVFLLACQPPGWGDAR
jgi:hypothetical protein